MHQECITKYFYADVKAFISKRLSTISTKKLKKTLPQFFHFSTCQH